MIEVQKLFPDRQSAEAFIDEYCKQFHPMGYGTQATINTVPPVLGSPNKFAVRITRGESCE